MWVQIPSSVPRSFLPQIAALTESRMLMTGPCHRLWLPDMLTHKKKHNMVYSASLINFLAVEILQYHFRAPIIDE